MFKFFEKFFTPTTKYSVHFGSQDHGHDNWCITNSETVEFDSYMPPPRPGDLIRVVGQSRWTKGQTFNVQVLHIRFDYHVNKILIWGGIRETFYP